MSEHITFHRHDLDIHIATTRDGELIDHSCIATVNAGRPSADVLAEFITRACDSHEDLLAACKEIWLYEDDMFDEILEGDLGPIKTSGLCDALKQLEAAIEKAEPKPEGSAL